ncbi:hypothetical protein K2Z83_27595 [Oscillochloris sp. ZM17-4]|uniref:hypothetical protein n=1 Tax=Oscillochloris sp. ZM17-4 TaxID=2866714 RepID=UPI001C72EE75|nr:hypothetical protein [Oscillochloris sp. ZM17-4]MBX0331421.1 hypothetical protein [Oscillochloris sp. ZM17-4]
MSTSPTVTRTYRAAIRLGEDYITLEETITLPLDAGDDAVQRAVDLGWRIYTAQHEAVAQQASQVRADTPAAPASAPKPASDKQRAFIDTLAREVGWDGDALTAFAVAQGVDSWETMSAAQAAALIDAIKAQKAEQEQQQRAEIDGRQAGGRTTRRADPATHAQARQALAEAEQRTGAGQPRQALPPIGDRIRNPNDPASEAQITKIVRTVERLNDAELQQLAPQIATVLGYQRVALKGLRDSATWPYLRDEAEQAHRLTKGRASQIIALLDTANAEKVAA